MTNIDKSLFFHIREITLVRWREIIQLL